MNTRLLRHLLLDSVFPHPQHDGLMDKLAAVGETPELIELDEFIESSRNMIGEFRPCNLRKLDTSKYNPDELAEVVTKYNEYRNSVFPPQHHHIYVKIETGGFTGYNSQLGGLGEKLFPVLRVMLKYKDQVFEEYINPKGAEKHISNSTAEYLERTNILTKALASPYDNSQVNEMIIEWLDKVGVPKHAPSINRYRHLVSANAEFNNKFIFNQLWSIQRRVGPTNVDINTVVNTIESTGVNVVPLNVYVDNPARYLDKMQEYHKILIQGLSYV